MLPEDRRISNQPRYHVESDTCSTGIDYIIVDTETDRVIRNLGSDYDLAAEIADDWNTHGYSPDRNDPWEHTIWSLTERRLDHDRSAILEQRFTHQEDDQCLEQ
ncbi:MAG TPA: hypothetical protein VKF37_10955 [Chloroflexota bacterium]|nr:hypothetical protein [Chloroflexota bacterium]